MVGLDLKFILCVQSSELAINESVFLSLLGAHCAVNDAESVETTLEVMKASGLSVGAETVTRMAESYARHGHWQQALAALQSASHDDIKLDDGDVFCVMRACCQAGLFKEAESLVALLPKKRGFFQELRNTLPQILLNGAVDLALDLFLSARNREDYEKEGQGRFIVSPLARCGADLDKIAEAAVRLLQDGYSHAPQFLIQEVATDGDQEKCKLLVEKIKEANNGEQFKWDREIIFRHLRQTFSDEKSPDKMMAYIMTLRSTGLFVPPDFLASDLIPHMLDLERELPGELVRRIRTQLPIFHYSIIANCMMQSLLNFDNDTGEHFSAATGFLLNVNAAWTFVSWNASLARSYLRTNNIENLVSILFAGNAYLVQSNLSEKEKDRSREHLFHSLIHIVGQAHLIQPGVAADDLLVPVLQQLDRHKVCVPPRTVSLLRRELKTEEAGALLDKAEKVWSASSDYWTSQAIEQFLAERKALLTRGSRDPVEKGSVAALERTSNILASKGISNHKISDELILAHVKEGSIERALKTLETAKENSADFHLSPSSLELIVNHLVKADRPKDALNLLNSTLMSENKVFSRSLMRCLAELAKNGEHELVIETIENLHIDHILVDDGLRSNLLLEAYTVRGEADRLEEVFNLLVEKDLINTKNHLAFAPVIDVHLKNNDPVTAIARFETFAVKYKKLVRKTELTCRLIEDEDVEGIQTVLDTSTKVVSQEKSIYDLALSFLLCNEKDKARKLLETPGLQYIEKTVDTICDFLVERRALTNLEEFVNITQVINGCNRDRLFLRLVDAYKNDAAKVDDIWLQVQEENHIPSPKLQLTIAKCLENGGRTVPFETESLIILAEDRKKDDTLKKQKVKVENDTETPVNKMIELDDYVREALTQNDLNKALDFVMESITEDKKNTTTKTKELTLIELLREKKLSEAAQLAGAISHYFKKPEKIRFRRHYYDILDQLGDDNQTFLDSLNPALRELLLKERRKNYTEITDNIKADNLDEAASRLLEMCADDKISVKKVDTSIRNICEIFEKWEERSMVQKTIEFVSKLGPKYGSRLKGQIWIKNGLIKTDPGKYLELLRTAEGETGKWLVSTDVLLQGVKKFPELRGQLESLALEKFTPASVLLAKLSLAEKRPEKVDEFLQDCPDIIQSSRYGGIFDKVDTLEKMNIALDAVEKSKLSDRNKAKEQIVNNCLSWNRNNPEFVEIANEAMGRGMTTKGLASTFREELNKKTDFVGNKAL